ncbi:MAG TPA: RIP metalloprotease RseP [Bryobacteraceae bacterium]|nr:RIP metalloprotease RseP [Bryobacteraceae bacterium]
MTTLLNELWWLLVLIGVMILVHELGHFWAARFFKIKVDVFSFGFGPRLFGFKRGDTDYRFSLFLFGGYVKMVGDQPGDAHAADPDGFLAKPRWQRLIVLAAGPFMNVVLAVAVLTGLYMVSYEKIIDDNGATVGHVVANSPAAKAGIQVGDKIVKIDGDVNPDWEAILTREIASVDSPMSVTVERGKKTFQTTVTPVLDEKSGVGDAGWEGQNTIMVGEVTPGMPAEKAGLQKGDVLVRVNGVAIHSGYTLPDLIRRSDGKPVTVEYSRAGLPPGTTRTVVMLPQYKAMDGKVAHWMIGVAPQVKWNIQKTSLSLPAAFAESVNQNAKFGTLIVEMLRGIVERRVPAKNLSGPIGIASQATEAAKEGPASFLTLMSMVSLNLAILNLLPIPILDGAHILTLLIEMVMGRDISLNVKEGMLKVGFVFLMMLMVFVIYNDIARQMAPGLLLSTPVSGLLR